MRSMPFETLLPNSEDGHLGLFYLQFMALFNTTESVLLIFGYDSLLVLWRNWPLCLECRIKRGSGCLWSYDFLPHYHSGRWFGSSEEKIFLKDNPSHFFFFLTRSQLWSSPGEVAWALCIVWGRLQAEGLGRGLYTCRSAEKQRKLVARLRELIWDSWRILRHLQWRNNYRFSPVNVFSAHHTNLWERHSLIVLKINILYFF